MTMIHNDPQADITIDTDGDVRITAARNVRVMRCRTLDASDATIGGGLHAFRAQIGGGLHAGDARIDGENVQKMLDLLRKGRAASIWKGKEEATPLSRETKKKKPGHVA